MAWVVAMVWIWSLAWELPPAASAAKKKKFLKMLLPTHRYWEHIMGYQWGDGKGGGIKRYKLLGLKQATGMCCTTQEI